MRLLLPTLFFLGLTGLLSAQEVDKSQLGPCGSPVGIDPWLINYTEHPGDYLFDRSDDPIYVGLQIHLVAKDNGTSRFPVENLLNAFCQLNQDYEQSGIRFYFKNPWNLIDSTGWHKHADLQQGISMMLTNNVPDALNIYFVSDPAGNCGYNLPYGGVAIAHSCAFEGDHTWAHEVGHALSLPHPFLGWEGKTYNYGVATPETVTYDYTYFHDTIQTGPGPLDTAFVERVNGSNCTFAADRICDTKPDYLSYRWDCDAQNNSLVKMKDQDGLDFYSDGTLFMSYSLDKCQNRFSDDQITRMRANLLTQKQPWIFTGTPEPTITEAAVLLDPINDAPAPNIGATLHWAPVPGATGYVVQASRFSSFTVKEVNVYTTDTMVTVGTLGNNTKYYWKVRPFNNWDACAAFSPVATFNTMTVVGTGELEKETWRCYPSLLRAGQLVVVEIPETWLGQTASLAIYDATGRQVWQSKQTLLNRRLEQSPVTASWATGLYHLVFTTAKGTKTQALTVE